MWVVLGLRIFMRGWSGGLEVGFENEGRYLLELPLLNT